MKITSHAFSPGGIIPDKYSCKGENVNPQLEFSGTPDSTQSLALILDDPDAPNGTFTHWVIYNISPNVREILESTREVPWMEAKNGAGEYKYMGPCPPAGIHRYYFKLYALDVILDVKKVIDKITLLDAMKGHILEEAELMGRFSK